MAGKRTGVVWVYSILVILAIVLSIVGNIAVLVNPMVKLLKPVEYYASLIALVLVIPYAIFIIMFFMLKRNSLIWLYISFGISFITQLVIKSWFYAAVVLIVGWAVQDYIRNKKVDNQNIFT